MSKFIYKMENILGLKEKIEEQKKIDFSNASKKYMNEQEKYKTLKKRQQMDYDRFQKFINGEINPLRLKHFYNLQEHIRNLIIQQNKIVIEAEEKMELARSDMKQAVIERKIHDKLKENERLKFLKEQNIQEQKILDEMTYRYLKKRK